MNPNKLIAESALAVLEQANHDIRHLFVANDYLRRPVVRLLLGAVVARQVEWDTARGLLEKLAEHEQDNNAAILEKLEGYPVGALKNAGQSAQGFSGRTYLLVDDQVAPGRYKWQGSRVVKKADGKEVVWDLTSTDAGWGPVLAAVLKSTVICGSSKDNLDLALKSSLEFDAVLLDYEFGPGDGKRGGDFLAGIKNAKFDLPVVIFTGADESAIVKWCLTNGASGYWVKERGELEGRNSLAAFNDLLEVLKAQFRFGNWKRTLWRKYVALEPRLEAFELSFLSSCRRRNPPTVSRFIRHTFLPLFLESSDPAKGGKSWAFNDHTQASAIALCNALSEFCRCWWLYNNRDQYDREWENLVWGSATPTKTHTLVALANLNGSLTEGWWNKLETAPHRGMPSMKAVLSALEEFLERLEQWLPGNGLTGRIDRLSTKGGAIAPATQRGSGVALNHAQTAEFGAKEMQKAIEALHRADPTLLECSLTSPLRILFVDDEPGEWVNVLERLFGSDSIVPEKPQQQMSKSARSLLGYDLVLLDLKCPRAENGLSILEKLHKVCRWVPVVMLTAGDDAAYTTRALEKGATDYFLKRQPVNPTDVSLPARDLIELVTAVAERYGRGRLFREVSSFTSAKGFLSGNNQQTRDRVKAQVEDVLDSLDICLPPLDPARHVRTRWWLDEGLHKAATDSFRKSDTQSKLTPGPVALAVACGRVVEQFAQAGRSRGQTAMDVARTWSGQKGEIGVTILKARNAAAHGKLSYFYQGQKHWILPDKDPKEAVKRVMEFLKVA